MSNRKRFNMIRIFCNRLFFISLQLCFLLDGYAVEVGHAIGSSSEGLKQSGSDSWHLTGHNSGSSFRLIKKSTSTTDAGGGRIDRFSVSPRTDSSDVFCSEIQEIVFSRDPLGSIESIRVLLAVPQPSLVGLPRRPDLATRVKNASFVGWLRKSILLFLVASGEMKWGTAIGGSTSISTVLPNCDFQVGIVGDASEDAIPLGRFFTPPIVEARQFGKHVAYFQSPDTPRQGYYYWICGDVNKPHGAVMSSGCIVDNFGREFRGVDKWAGIASATNCMSNSAQSPLDRFMATITPSVKSLSLDVDAETYLNEDWLWRVQVGNSLEGLSELGTLRMMSTQSSRDEFWEWREKIFAFTPQGKGKAKSGPFSQVFPDVVVCRRNNGGQITSIEAKFKSLNSSILNDSNVDAFACNLVGLLMSTGALDLWPPSDKIIPGMLPIGTLKIPFANHASLMLLAGDDRVVFTRSLADTGLVNDNEMRIEWVRTLALDNEFREGFSGQFEGISGRYSVKMDFLRFGTEMDRGRYFCTPPVASFQVDRSIDEWETRISGQMVWCIRATPRPDYFVCLNEQHMQAMRREMLAKRPDPKASVEASKIQSSRLSQLLKWLTVEEAGSVFRSLSAIERAKRLWAQNAGVDPNQKATWDDIAPFLVSPRDQLPHPQDGEYLLGDTPSSFPDYQPKASDRIQSSHQR